MEGLVGGEGRGERGLSDRPVRKIGLVMHNVYVNGTLQD